MNFLIIILKSLTETGVAYANKQTVGGGHVADQNRSGGTADRATKVTGSGIDVPKYCSFGAIRGICERPTLSGRSHRATAGYAIHNHIIFIPQGVHFQIFGSS